MGLIAGIVAIVVAFLGPTTAWSSLPEPFYGLEFIGFIYILPIWMLVLAIYFLGFSRTSNKIIGILTGVIGLGAAALGFLVAAQFFPIRQPFTGGWSSWLASWEMATLVSGIAILFFGIAYIKVHMPTRSSSPYGTIAGVLYLFVGIFGVLIGLGTGLAAFPLFSDFSLIPWMYAVISVPSLFGIKS